MNLWGVIGILIILLAACTVEKEYQFELLEGKRTGLDFSNDLLQTEEWNVFNYMYFFNGGGLAAGDLNNDGFVDLYFTANMGPNKLFLNNGDLTFTDVSNEAAVVGSKNWNTGVSLVDINQDGLLDIYVSQVSGYAHFDGHNQLFVCQKIENGIPRYAEKSNEYGLDLVGFGTQAVFFDYDRDDDLDLFQLNHSLHQNGTFGARPSFALEQHPLAGDKLMRNDGGRFVDVTNDAGILSTVLGYGLGVKISDLNNDGWPDIYVGNDFHENDYLYINQKNGTFSEELAEQIRHCSRFSMGVDIADINNDGYEDILSLDMLPEDPTILKSSLGEDGYSIYHYKINQGYHHQFARNHLQLNNGDGTYSEIAMYAGIEATDWSWAPLIFDFDNDGFKDVFISNGIPRRMNDIDYINFRSNNTDKNSQSNIDLSWTDQMPQIKLPNKFFRNSGALKFEDIGAMVKGNKDSYSNGSVVVDLDNDGLLDVVVNNIEDKPYVYHNVGDKTKNDFLSFRFIGPKGNLNGIGCRIEVDFTDGRKQMASFYPVTGFQSTNHDKLHIGIASESKFEKIKLIWPDGTQQHLDANGLNRTIEVHWQNHVESHTVSNDTATFQSVGLIDRTKEAALDYVHRENEFVHFNRETLTPFMTSADGPALAIGDINGDGLEDVFVGSSKREVSALYFQIPDGTFRRKYDAVLAQDSIYEEVDAAFVDIDNDADLDLVVATGGNEFKVKSLASRQRLYLNNGNGTFMNTNALDSFHLTASIVSPCDFDLDGDVDLFFGGRCVPWAYGLDPTSYLLENNGNGGFKKSSLYSPDLIDLGMVTDAQWVDINNDSLPDLVVCSEWGTIKILINRGHGFESVDLSDDYGWWRCLHIIDYDDDGDLDIMAGNLGENSRLRPSLEQPVELYVTDFDDNGQVDQLLTYYVKDKKIPFANFAEIMKQLPNLRKDFLYAQDFATTDFEEIFGQDKLDAAQHLKATSFSHLLFENKGNGLQFTSQPLPQELQLAPINTFAPLKIDEGKKIFMVYGNDYQANIEMGRYDASYGSLLQISNKKLSTVYNRTKITGQVQNALPIEIVENTCILIVKNNAPVQLLCLEELSI